MVYLYGKGMNYWETVADTLVFHLATIIIPVKNEK